MWQIRPQGGVPLQKNQPLCWILTLRGTPRKIIYCRCYKQVTKKEPLAILFASNVKKNHQEISPCKICDIKFGSYGPYVESLAKFFHFFLSYVYFFQNIVLLTHRIFQVSRFQDEDIVTVVRVNVVSNKGLDKA